MNKIDRAVKTFSEERFDLIVVGGGIYGIMLCLEGVRRGLRPLLLEKDDFCGATSHNHLRTVHGGLRYLQKTDLIRFVDSVGERKHFLRYFPGYVQVLPCMMPLYNRGKFRTDLMTAALKVNDLLSFYRNFFIQDKTKHLPSGRVVPAAETKAIFAQVDPGGLKGGAAWYDACLAETQRFYMHVLKTAAARGCAALNYVEVTGLLKEGRQTAGVTALDRETGESVQFLAPVVVNACGPHSRKVAELLDRDHEKLFRKSLLLWNVLFDRPALSNHALGVTPGKGKGHMYFSHPWKDRLLVGTGELLLPPGQESTTVPAGEMERFIADLNKAVPGLGLTQQDISRVYSGILPATEKGKLSGRPAFVDHGKKGGPIGLYSLAGVKFTTARQVADRTLDRIFPCQKKCPWGELAANGAGAGDDFFPAYQWQPGGGDQDPALLKNIVDTEAVVHLSDLVLRRTSLGDNPAQVPAILPTLEGLFDWDEPRRREERRILEEQLQEGWTR